MVDAEHDTGFVEVDVIEQTGAKLTLVGGPIGPVPQGFRLAGSSTVEVLFEGAEGDADDDDGNNRDEVETELVQLNLSGGGISVSLNPAQRSFGGIEELVNNTPGRLDLDPFHPGDADSFFDVFFQVDVGGGLVLHNDQPHAKPVGDFTRSLRVGERYIYILPPSGPVELLDAAGNPTGIFLVDAEHATGFVEVDMIRADQRQAHPGGRTYRSCAAGLPPGRQFDRGGAVRGWPKATPMTTTATVCDEVETELVELNLTGGGIAVSLNPYKRSFGGIEELVNNNGRPAGSGPVPPGRCRQLLRRILPVRPRRRIDIAQRPAACEASR